MRQKAIKTPPLCLATLNIGEVARSDGGVNTTPCNLSQPLLFRNYRIFGFSPIAYTASRKATGHGRGEE